MSKVGDEFDVDNDVVVRSVNEVVNSINASVSFYENRIGGALYDAIRKVLEEQKVAVKGGEAGFYYLEP